jgi:EmrB/QacA subfamily drug resistance transporter
MAKTNPSPRTSSQTSSQTSPPAEPLPARRWLALPVVLLGGVFMTILDFAIVNVMIPSMQADLHASSAEIQLVVAGYSLAYGAGLITGGRLGDRYGRRRIFTLGMVLFTLASVACGVAPGAVTLVVARIIQGAAAAVLFPQVLAIINVTYTGADRPRAFTWYGVTLGAAMCGGQVIGGLLIGTDLFGLGWRSCFLINVPIGLLCLAVVRLTVPESRSETARRLDLGGVALVTLGIALLVFPLVEGRQTGWPAWAWICLAASVPVLWVFLRQQSRVAEHGGSPLLEPALLRSRAFPTGLASVLATYAGMASFFLVYALYLQDGEGYDALRSGLAFLPLGLGFVATSLLGAKVAALLGRHSISIGGVVLAGAEAVLAVVAGTADGSGISAWALVGPLALVGVGMGIVMTPLIARVLSGVAADHAGSTSGMLSTMQQVGNSMGVALIGVVFFGVLGPASGADGTSYTHAFQAGLGYTAVMALAVSALVASLPRPAAAR